MNLGLDNLTSATLDLIVGGNSVLSYNWSGNLETYGMEDVQMGSYQFNGSTDFSIRITSSDENADNDEIFASVDGATESTTLFYIYLTTDGWGEETGWEIRDQRRHRRGRRRCRHLRQHHRPTKSTWACPAPDATPSR